MRITLAQTSPRLNRSNLDETILIIDSLRDKTDLVVFGELSLSGYMLQDKLYEDAWDISELDVLKDLSKHLDIVVGAAIRDEGCFKNSALYFSNGKLLSRHDKVHLPNYGMFEEARYFKSGNIFESFSTKFGKISMAVCEDLWHGSAHKSLIKEKPDYIIALVASPARGFNDEGLEIQEKWYDIIKPLALECKTKLLFVNRVGFEDGLGFWGGSCIVDAKANIIHQLPLYEKTVKTFEIKEDR